MAIALKNRVNVLTSTSGTGTITLGDAFTDGFATEVEAGLSDGDETIMIIEEGLDWEISRGVYTASGRTLTRATVQLSKISGVSGTTKLTLAGGANVRIGVDADYLNSIVRGDEDQELTTTQKTQARTNINAGVGPAHNLITNPDFDLWQRGTAHVAIATNTFSADRWRYDKVGAMVHTVSRSTDVPTVAESAHLSSYSLLLDCTTIDSSLATGDYAVLRHAIEGYNFRNIAQQEFTISFWVKGTKTGIHCVAVQNSGQDRSYVAEYTINSTNTWEKKTITVAASPSAGTWNYTIGAGLSVWFVLACGSAYHTTKDAWQSSQVLATSSQVNACDSASNDFRIAQVQLEVGDTATPFVSRIFGTELTYCQRHFTKSALIETAPADHLTYNVHCYYGEGGNFSATNTITGSIPLPVTMPDAPTISFLQSSLVAGNAGQWSYWNGSTWVTTTAVSVALANDSQFTVQVSGSWSIGLSTYMAGGWTAVYEI